MGSWGGNLGSISPELLMLQHCFPNCNVYIICTLAHALSVLCIKIEGSSKQTALFLLCVYSSSQNKAIISDKASRCYNNSNNILKQVCGTSSSSRATDWEQNMQT